MLSPNQRNGLLKAIELQKLSYRNFKIEATEEWVRVTHKPTNFHFRFQPQDVRTNRGQEVLLYLYYTPSKPGAVYTAKQEASVANLDSFERAMPHFNGWLALLKQEFEQPDLWAEMEHTPLMFADEESVTDERFTQGEIKLLEERVAEVEQRVLTLNLPPEAEAAITATVREVPAKAKRFTKKELADSIVGSLVKEGFKWGLTTEHMAAVWHGFQYFFTTYIGPHIL